MFNISNETLEKAIYVKLVRTDERIKEKINKIAAKELAIPYIKEDFVINAFEEFLEEINKHKDTKYKNFNIKNFLHEDELEEEFNKNEIRNILFAVETLIKNWLKDNEPGNFAVYSDFTVHVMSKECSLMQHDNKLQKRIIF